MQQFDDDIGRMYFAKRPTCELGQQLQGCSLRRRQEFLTITRSSSYLDGVVKPSEVLTQTASEDPEIGLRGVAALRALLEAVEELQVRRARELGWSWQQIAGPLGVSKQAVHQKYATGTGQRRRRFR